MRAYGSTLSLASLGSPSAIKGLEFKGRPVDSGAMDQVRHHMAKDALEIKSQRICRTIC